MTHKELRIDLNVLPGAENVRFEFEYELEHEPTKTRVKFKGKSRAEAWKGAIRLLEEKTGVKYKKPIEPTE